jgi:catechol 2,3-dioxygenase-like lactoylglutathione lyase family enzyme
MLLRHLALAVTDERRSQAFYERWFGFDASRRMDDGVLMLYGPGDVALALGPAEGPPSLPAFLHFGFVLDSPEAVRESRDAFAAANVEEVDFWDEPDYVSVKVRDPDGYVVEVSWEPSAESP